MHDLLTNLNILLFLESAWPSGILLSVGVVLVFRYD
jgi:hypothetical protein